MSHFKLRPYQAACIAAIPETGSYLIQMATGLGKTVTFSQVPRRGRMLLLSHREELVRQPAKYFDCSFGVEQAGEKSHGEMVVSASVQSLIRRLGRFAPDTFDIIITDEAHHAAAKTYKKIFEYFKPRLHLGFTATPNRGDNLRLDDVYEDIIFERDLKWGIQNGYLSDIDCLRVNVGYDLSGVARRMGDYAPRELEKVVNQDALNIAVAEAYHLYAKGQTLIFAVSVAHAEAIAKLIPGAVAISGGTKNRSQLIEQFKNQAIPCLVNCMVFTEGTDIPNIETVMVARPTQSAALYTQMVGRGTRLYPGKEKLTLIDLVGASGKHNLCTAPSLIGVDIPPMAQNEQDQIMGDLFDLPALITKVADKPESWVRNVEYVDLWAREQQYQTHNVNYFKMPDGSLVCSLPKGSYRIPAQDELGNTLIGGKKVPMQRALDGLYKLLEQQHREERYLWDLTKAKRWGSKAASDKQKRIIERRLKNYDTTYLTKLQASQILNRIFYRE
ncbi:MAG: DEAD/DEAH box helicase [Eubacterium sp.]